MTRALTLAAWRAIVPSRPGFTDADLGAALDVLLATLPPSGRVGFRLAVLARAILGPTFGARPPGAVHAALERHRLAPLRKLAQMLKGTLFLAALARPEGRAGLGVET